MKWNKLTTRPLTDEEREEFGSTFEFMWDGVTPDENERVLVYDGDGNWIDIDIWININGDSVGFENTYADTVYWMPLPELPKEE